MRHLLEIRRHVRVVAREVDVVEDDVDDVLDAVAEVALRRRRPAPCGGDTLPVPDVTTTVASAATAASTRPDRITPRFAPGCESFRFITPPSKAAFELGWRHLNGRAHVSTRVDGRTVTGLSPECHERPSCSTSEDSSSRHAPPFIPHHDLTAKPDACRQRRGTVVSADESQEGLELSTGRVPV